MSVSHQLIRQTGARIHFRFGLVVGLGLVFAALSCSGGGGSGGDCDSAICLGFSSSGSSAEEGTTVQVQIELHSSDGPLVEDLPISLSIGGASTATLGVDYPALQSTGLAFSAGAEDMDTLVVPIALIDDSSVEGADETLELILDAQVEGVSISAGTYTITIQDGDQATITFTQGQETTPDEADATYTASIALALDAGDTLGTGVSVVVSDEGQGTATGGTDFDTFNDQTINFAAGSANGDSVDVSLTVRDDVEPEVSETAILELGTPSAGVILGTNTAYALTITEDDVSPDAFLLVMGDDTPGGSLAPMASGDTRDFGTQTLLAGAGAVLQVQLSNAGQSDLGLEPFSVSGDTRDFRINTNLESVSSLSATGQNLNLSVANRGPMPLDPTTASVPIGVAYAYNPSVAATMIDQDNMILDGLIAPSGEVLSLELAQIPLPIASDAELWVDGVEVPGGFDTALAGVTVWRGSVVGNDGSEAFLALSPDQMQGWVQYGASDAHDVFHLVPAGDGELVIVASDQDFAALSPTAGPLPCLGEPLPDNRTDAPGMGEEPDTENLGVGITFASGRLAIETDYHLFTLFGDQTAVTTYVTELIAAVSSAYERDVQTTLEIAYLGVYTTASDPWSSGDNPGDDTLDLLDEFRTTWNASGWPVEADLAHFISGANLGGGVAYVGVLCSQAFGFGVSANLNGNIDWGTFTGAASPFTWDFVVVSHELGHNFGASHTQDYCPPLDTCYANCTGNTACGRSTIMSYCHLCGAGLSNIDLKFHPFNSDIIRNEISGSCLGSATLAPGSTLDFELTFEPVDSAGAKAVSITFSHDATNEPSPFRLDLSGTAQN